VKLTFVLLLFTFVRGVTSVNCPELSTDTLDLSNKGLTADDVRDLLNCQHLGSVKTLNISGNNLTSLSLDT